MKIAIYSGNIPSTIFIENLIDGLSKAGFEILLFGKRKGKVNYNGNIRLYYTPTRDLNLFFFVLREFSVLLFRNPKLFFKSVKVLRKKRRKIRLFFKEAGMLLPILNHQPDIFHIQWAKTIEQNPELFELLNCKFVLSLRGAHINYSPIADNSLAESYKKYFAVIDGFHAVSEAICLEAQKYGAERKKIKVIHSSVGNELLGKRPELCNQPSVLEIISIGRFHWKKGYHYALDAMKILADDGINFMYTIVAQGEIPEEIIFLINEYGLKEKVTIILGMSYEKLIEKLQRSHMLLLSSVEEGIANVVLEAMALEIPVVTTDCGGMKEVIKDEVNGHVVPVRNSSHIAKKIKELINYNYESKSILTRNAKETIRKEFSRKKQIDEFISFYNLLSQ